MDENNFDEDLNKNREEYFSKLDVGFERPSSHHSNGHSYHSTSGSHHSHHSSHHTHNGYGHGSSHHSGDYKTHHNSSSMNQRSHEYYSHQSNVRRNENGQRPASRTGESSSVNRVTKQTTSHSTYQGNYFKDDSSSMKTPKNRKSHNKKKMSKSKKVVISIVCIFFVICVGVYGVGMHYLNKLNFDDGNLVTAPVNPDGEDAGDTDILNGNLSPEDSNSLSGANASINANLNNKEIWYSNDVKNILLMGIDYGSSGFPYGRSDSMIVVSINEVTHKVKLISLSRALYSAIEGYSNTRLSHAHGYGGAPLAIKAIQNNYKIRIDNYASVNFSGFESIIDAVGGVKITLSAAEANAIRGVLGTSKAGTYNLNGKQALAYARTRKIDSDRDRTGRQRKVLESLASKATSLAPTELISMMDKVLPLVTTDLSRTQLIGYLTKAVSYLGYEREQHVLPHKSSPLVLRGGFEVILVDWADEIPYVHELFYGDVEAKTIKQ